MTEVEPVLKAGKKRRKAKPRTDRDVATRIHAQIVRDHGFCEAAERGWLIQVDCAGSHECAHIIDRAWATTRTDLENGLCLCQAHHRYIDNYPGGLMHELVDPDLFHKLQVKARRGIREWSGLTTPSWWSSERERLTEIAKARGIL